MRFFYILLLLAFLSNNQSFAAEKNELPVYSSLDTARISIATSMRYHQKDFGYNFYPLLVYLRNHLVPDSLMLNPDAYEKRLNDHDYKRYFLYSKILGKNTVVSSTCLDENETGKWDELYKLLFYSIYDGPDWKFPSDYVKKLDEYSTEGAFDGPVLALIDIYFLKQYNYGKLSGLQKEDLKELEDRLCGNLFNGYVKDQQWGYYKVLALWAIRINKNPVADSINVNELTDYYDRQYWMMRFISDYENKELMNNPGGKFTFAMSNLCTLWLFTLNK